MFRFGLCVGGMLLLLAACSTSGGGSERGGGLARVSDTGAGGPGVSASTRAVEADVACTRSCNRSHAICEDAGVGRRGGERAYASGGQCQRQLSQCLAACQPAAPKRSPDLKPAENKGMAPPPSSPSSSSSAPASGARSKP